MKRLTERLKLRLGKRGSILVETSILLPVFIIALLVLISILPVIVSCEEAVFTATDQLRQKAITSAFVDEKLSLPGRLTSSTLKNCREMNHFAVYHYRENKNAGGVDEIIEMGAIGSLGKDNPLGIMSEVIFREDIRCRRFTGTFYGGDSTSSDEDDTVVYVFPKRGGRYHKKSCPHLNPACRLTYLSSETKKRYKPCSICKSKGEKLGTPVFCFDNEGKVYHISSCPTVDKYYIEMKKSDAVKKGYTPCSTCGG